MKQKVQKGKLSHTTRDKFDSGQIKTHFGKALVKLLEQKAVYPDATVAIAHPYDEYLMNVLSIVRPEIQKLGFKMYWVRNEFDVLEE